MNRMTSTLAAAGVLAAAAPAALADVLTFEYEGFFTQVNDPENLLGGATEFSGTYAFDTEATDQDGFPQIGVYAAMDYTFGTGDVFFTVDDAFIRVADDLGFVQQDEYWVLAQPGATGEGYSVEVMDLFLADLDHTVFGSDGLPTTPPPVGEFEISQFALQFAGPDGSAVEALGQITSLTLVPAPGAMAALGMAGLFGRRRRR